MKILLTIFLMFIVGATKGQQNFSLSILIDSLTLEDQKWRNLLTKIDNSEVDTIERKVVARNIHLTDSTNILKAIEIFNIYGFPGFDIVGKMSSHNYWLLIQHADKNPEFQEQVLLKMKVQVDKMNASGTDYAYLVDRVKVNTGQAQIYGTQMKLNSDSSSYIPKYLFEPEKVNDRRKSVGLSTIESYIETMNNRYFGTLKK